FVARLNASLTALRQATYLGGNSGGNEADALAIAPATGDVYVAGQTSAADLPGTAGGAQSANGGIDPTSGNNSTDAFVARLSADLTPPDQAPCLRGNKRDLPTTTGLPASGGYAPGRARTTTLPGT